MKITRRQLKRIIREAIEEGWNEALKLTSSAVEFLQGWDWEPGMSGGGWVEAWYKGPDPEAATEWIVVTNDGGYYKVGAQYMVWTPGWNQAAWSDSHMEKQVQAAKAGQDPPRDPGYRT
jgi:hypothetical protein